MIIISCSTKYNDNKFAKRDIENVRQTIENSKHDIYVLYNEALNEHPKLTGRLVFSFIILPNGKITNLRLLNSTLGLVELEQSMLKRIEQIDFGSQNVSLTDVEYQFVFFPN